MQSHLLGSNKISIYVYSSKLGNLVGLFKCTLFLLLSVCFSLNTSIGEMPRREKSSKQRTLVGTVFTCLPLSSGVPVPMCYRGDACRVAISNEEETYKQRY